MKLMTPCGTCEVAIERTRRARGRFASSRGQALVTIRCLVWWIQAMIMMLDAAVAYSAATVQLRAATRLNLSSFSAKHSSRHCWTCAGWGSSSMHWDESNISWRCSLLLPQELRHLEQGASRRFSYSSWPTPRALVSRIWPWHVAAGI